uniref:Ig-like domain-containing protein n=1 Tax=Ascaris lumbricoides TaxID=6252 RepID=A0A0M3IWD5_ASCLU
MKDEKAKRLQGRQVGQKASTEKRNPLEGIKLKKVPRTESESSASGTPSSSRRGTLTELPEFVRRSSGVSGDVSRKGSLVRRSSVDMRCESISEILEKTSTPLVPTGPVGPPHIAEIPENVTVPENETAILKCKVQGNPVPTVKWSKGLREVSSNISFLLATIICYFNVFLKGKGK